jgi:pimeloyl-ACP methyl ester carboxylesterase
MNVFRSNKKQAIVICHGYREYKDMQIFVDLARHLSSDFDVYVLDMRGHGESGGGFTIGARELKDTACVLEHIKDRYESIGMIGVSIGTMVSLQTAAAYPQVKSLYLISSMTDLSELDRRWWSADAWKALVAWDYNRGKVVRLSNPFLHKDKPIELVAELDNVSKAFVHGSEDWLIDPDHSRELYEESEGTKELVILQGAGHADHLMYKEQKFLEEHCKNWFKHTLKNKENS